MSGQLTQLELGEQAKAEGIAQAAAHAVAEWKARFAAVAMQVLDDNGSVTSDEVIEVVGLPPGHPNGVGAMMHVVARRLGLKCNYERSLRPSRHRAIVGRWRKS